MAASAIRLSPPGDGERVQEVPHDGQPGETDGKRADGQPPVHQPVALAVLVLGEQRLPASHIEGGEVAERHV